MRGNADSAEVCCHCVLTKSSMSADQSADSMPHADSIRLFLCGDVMTGTREQSGPASSQRSHLARTCIGDARTYVELAERVNGAIPSPTEFDYIWGRENPSEGTDRGESRNVAAIALKPQGIVINGFDAKEQQTLIDRANAQRIDIVGWHAGATPGPLEEPQLFVNVASDRSRGKRWPHGFEELGALMISQKTKRFLAA